MVEISSTVEVFDGVGLDIEAEAGDVNWFVPEGVTNGVDMRLIDNAVGDVDCSLESPIDGPNLAAMYAAKSKLPPHDRVGCEELCLYCAMLPWSL
jgi:hypothetical protein